MFVKDLFTLRDVCRFVSIRFVSKQRKTFNAVGLSSLIFLLQGKEPRFSVRFNTFWNCNSSLNKRRMSPAQATTEWTAEKCSHKRQTTNDKRQTNPNRTNRWSKVQKQFKQQLQQCRLKDHFIFNKRISREFRFTQFFYAVRDVLNRICKTASNFETKNIVLL